MVVVFGGGGGGSSCIYRSLTTNCMYCILYHLGGVLACWEGVVSME